jgi:hypothetical protein
MTWINVVSAAIALCALFVSGFLAWTIRENGQRQLRAYAAVGEPHFGARHPVTVQIAVENNGQTPARRVTAHLHRKWVPYGHKLPKDFSCPDFGEVGPSSIAVLNPGKRKTFTFPIDPKELEQVRNKETALFLYGHVDYVDVFDELRMSEFNYRYSQIIGDDGKDRAHSLLMQPDHNDAK